MASETLGDSCEDLIQKARGRWTEKSIVYTRRNHKRAPKTSINNTPTTTASIPENPSCAVLAASTNSILAGSEASAAGAVTTAEAAVSPLPSAALSPAQGSGQAVLTNEKDKGPSRQSQQVLEHPQHGPSAANEDSWIRTHEPPNIKGTPSPNINPKEVQNFGKILQDGNKNSGSILVPQVKVNGIVKPLVISSLDDRIRFNLSKVTAKDDIKDFRRTLLSELQQVSKLVTELGAKELQIEPYTTPISNNHVSDSNNYVTTNGANITTYSHSQPSQARNELGGRRLMVRVNSEVGPLGHREPRHTGLARVNSDMGSARNMEPRLYSRQLRVAVTEKNNRGESFEKDKRTPKANQFYRNSEFLLGKERLPPESNKRVKTSNGRRHGGDNQHGFRFEKIENQMFKNCNSLLQRLMKHKHGWVFNEPVDAKAMGLVDYHDIIKHPMDLGTIKSRLSQRMYKSPRDFAEDVRLVFHNAMTYNPKGQDVHIMAEQLSQVFEERWGLIEAEYNSSWKHQMYRDGRLQNPASSTAFPQNHYGTGAISSYISSGAQMVAFDRPVRPEPTSVSTAVDPKAHRPHVGRTPVPKKPKAKDENKRDMTYEEKQRLSNNLQGLPSEKLDAIVQIIKKRNTALSQHDDEIEVDIDSVDPETLWELDRFVTNYKKSLSKNKRKAELALQTRTSTDQNMALANSVSSAAKQIRSGSALTKGIDPPADGDNPVNDGSRSSSSSSSSSDSGSSSSDSDSDSSSADGSDEGHSPVP